jgi:hypothetical protein
MSGAGIDRDDEGSLARRKPMTLELIYAAYDMIPLAHHLGDAGSGSAGTRAAARCCAAGRAEVPEYCHRFTHFAIASGDHLFAEEAAPCRPRRFGDRRNPTEQSVTSACAGSLRSDLPRHCGRGSVMRTRAAGAARAVAFPPRPLPVAPVRAGRESRAQTMTALRRVNGSQGKHGKAWIIHAMVSL